MTPIEVRSYEGRNPVACGQGMQVMLCMANELLRGDLLLLYKKPHGFGTKEEKFEANPERRLFLRTL